MKDYEAFMKKAHGSLILERENEIILELRATREFLDSKLEALGSDVKDELKVVQFRLDGIEKKIDSLIAALKL